MAKRFKLLKAGLKMLSLVGAEADTIPPPPPVGTIAERFATRASRNINYPADADRSRKLDSASVHPFALTYSATVVYKVSYSNKAKTAVATYVGTEAKLNHSTASDPKTVRGFAPAKAVIFIPSATQSTVKKTSQISGRKYNPTDGNSKTYPFGMGTTNNTFLLVKTDIAAGVIANNPNATVSFKPEDGRALG